MMSGVIAGGMLALSETLRCSESLAKRAPRRQRMLKEELTIMPLPPVPYWPPIRSEDQAPNDGARGSSTQTKP